MLEITVFICGTILMVVELVGSRVMSPYLGTSMFVWSGIIGVILGSLSLGYWIGGKLADQKAETRTLAMIIFVAGIFVLAIPLSDDSLLSFISDHFNIRTGAVIGSLLLFALPSILLGIVSPYAVRLKLKTLENAGRSVGNLYSISTLGSIAGTFLTGFYLLSVFGNQQILIISAVILIFLALYLAVERKLVFLIFIITIAIAGRFDTGLEARGLLVDTDSEYNRILVYDTDSEKYGPVRILATNSDNSQSAMFLNGKDDLVFDYAKAYRLADFFNPKIENALMIGGGGYSYPRDFLQKHPDSNLDVVEIDKKITDLAEEYFNLDFTPRLRKYEEDGRTFINKNKSVYDAVYVDAFRSSDSIPYYLTTKETAQKLYDRTSPDGAVLINMITAITGEKGKFFRAEYATYNQVFPQVYAIPLDSGNPDKVQNIVLIALKNPKVKTLKSDNKEYQKYLDKVWTKKIETDVPVLTDDFAPVDQYLSVLH